MKLITMIVGYNNEGRLNDFIDYIVENRSSLKNKDLNEVLKWAGRKPKDFDGKDKKIDEILYYLKHEYCK